MREWNGKDKDTVVTRLLDLTSSTSLIKADIELLYSSLGKTLPFNSHPEMLMEWNKIGVELNKYENYVSPETPESLKDKANFQSEAKSLLLSFRTKYSEYLSNDRINEIKAIEDSFELWYEFYNYLSFLFRKLLITTNPISQVKLIRDWLKAVSQRFIKFKHKKLSFFSYPIIEFFNDFVNGDIDEIKINMQPKLSGKCQREKLNSYANDMDFFSKNILECIKKSSSLEPLQKLPQKSDAVQALISIYDQCPDVYNSFSSSVTKSRESAEAKAFSRLKDLDKPNQWVIAVAREEDIDLEELDKKIRESSYLV